MSLSEKINSKRQQSALPCVFVAACAVLTYGSVLASTVKTHEVLSVSRVMPVATESRLAKVATPTIIASRTSTQTAFIAAR